MEIDSQGVIGFAGEVLSQAGIAGLILVIIVAGGAAYMILRAKGVSAKPPAADVTELKGIKAELGTLNQRFGEFDRRLVDVEHDLEDRPTRAELHVIEKTLVAINESSKARDDQISAIGAGVRRVEDFLISLSKGK